MIAEGLLGLTLLLMVWVLEEKCHLRRPSRRLNTDVRALHD